MARPEPSAAYEAADKRHARTALRVQRARAPGVGVTRRAFPLGEALEAGPRADAARRLGRVLHPVPSVPATWIVDDMGDGCRQWLGGEESNRIRIASGCRD